MNLDLLSIPRLGGEMFCYVWWLCVVIKMSVQYNGGFLPDIILLAQGYYHRGTRLNTMEWLCLYSVCNSITVGFSPILYC